MNGSGQSARAGSFRTMIKSFGETSWRQRVSKARRRASSMALNAGRIERRYTGNAGRVQVPWRQTSYFDGRAGI
jgi:hypothetical protein